MSEFTFREGDRVVRVKDDFDRNSRLKIGSTGTVIYLRKNSIHQVAGVLWDKPFSNGHSLGGRLVGEDMERGWNVRCDQIALLEETEPISIDFSEVL